MTMFALGSNSRQRPQSPSNLHYRPQEYYIPSALPPYPSLHQDSNPRQYAAELSRPDLYPHPTEHSPHLDIGLEYGHGESLPPNVAFNQSYDRRASTSESHAPPHIPYHNHHQQNSATGPVFDNISLAPYHQSFPPEQHSAAIGSTSEHLGDSEFWLEGAPAPSSENSKPRKPRLKPRIELAPDQPPTTQGKPRARVYVACLQWFVSSISSFDYIS
jgi:hypothetical protein